MVYKRQSILQRTPAAILKLTLELRKNSN